MIYQCQICTFKRTVSNSSSVSNSLLLATILSIRAEQNSEQDVVGTDTSSPTLVSGFLAEQFSTRLEASSASSSTTPGSARSTTSLREETSSIANATTTVKKFESERAQCRNSDKAEDEELLNVANLSFHKRRARGKDEHKVAN